MIDPLHAQEVREYLGPHQLCPIRTNPLLILPPDYREKDGYSVDKVDVYSTKQGTETVVVSGATVNFPITSGYL